MLFISLRIVAVLLLLWAPARHTYDYYTILRFVVCGVSSYGFYLMYESDREQWAWVFGGIAILFNPFLKIYFQKDTWALIDIAVAGIFLVSLFTLRKKSPL